MSSLKTLIESDLKSSPAIVLLGVTDKKIPGAVAGDISVLHTYRREGNSIFPLLCLKYSLP